MPSRFSGLGLNLMTSLPPVARAPYRRVLRPRRLPLAAARADPKQLPSFAQMLWDQIPSAHGGASTLPEYERDLDQRVRDTLY